MAGMMKKEMAGATKMTKKQTIPQRGKSEKELSKSSMPS